MSQDSPLPQTVPHEPQFWGSVSGSTHSPAQMSCPAGQVSSGVSQSGPSSGPSVEQAAWLTAPTPMPRAHSRRRALGPRRC